MPPKSKHFLGKGGITDIPTSYINFSSVVSQLLHRHTHTDMTENNTPLQCIARTSNYNGITKSSGTAEILHDA